MEIDDVIDRDIDRCLPSHQRFRQVDGEAYVEVAIVLNIYTCQDLTSFPSLLPGANGPRTHRQKALDDVLKAYAGYNPELGYCQGMGMIAGILLLHMPPDVRRAPRCGARNKQRPVPQLTCAPREARRRDAVRTGRLLDPGSAARLGQVPQRLLQPPPHGRDGDGRRVRAAAEASLPEACQAPCACAAVPCACCAAS